MLRWQGPFSINLGGRESLAEPRAAGEDLLRLRALLAGCGSCTSTGRRRRKEPVLVSAWGPSPIPAEGLNSLGPTGCEQCLFVAHPLGSTAQQWAASLPCRMMDSGAQPHGHLPSSSPPPPLLSFSCPRRRRPHSAVVHPVPPAQGGRWLRCPGMDGGFSKAWEQGVDSTENSISKSQLPSP